jgi:hypothetical protein
VDVNQDTGRLHRQTVRDCKRRRPHFKPGWIAGISWRVEPFTA